MLISDTPLLIVVMVDDDPSLLNKTQRRYLRGEKEIENKNQERVQRSRIRNRVQQGIMDLNLLWEKLAITDHEQIFDFDKLHRDSNEVETEKIEFRDGITAMISFVYSGLKQQGFGTEYFEELLEDGIREAEAYYPQHPEKGVQLTQVNVDIDINHYTSKELAILNELQEKISSEEIDDIEKLLTNMVEEENIDLESTDSGSNGS